MGVWQGPYFHRITYNSWCGVGYSSTQTGDYYFGVSVLAYYFSYLDQNGLYWFHHEEHECPTHCGDWMQRRRPALKLTWSNRIPSLAELPGSYVALIVPWEAMPQIRLK